MAEQRLPSAPEAARRLLGARIVGHGVSLRLTEVEAYAGPDDPASHAFRRTPRSAIMYGPPDRLYVYRIHGHHCANIVVATGGAAAAVLLRAGEVIDGVDLARRRRGEHHPDAALARGPGNLCRALGITIADLGVDVTQGPIRLESGGDPGPVAAGPRVGVRLAADRPWRFWLADHPTVSAYRRHPKA